MPVRVAVINSHPTQHFSPLWREVARREEVQLKVFYCSDWGVNEYADPDFALTFKWDVDLLSGYDSEFLPIRGRPKKLGFWETYNPSIGTALSKFGADVVVLFGYAHLTNWRALVWARRHRRRVVIFGDSELKHGRSFWRRMVKELVVRGFLSQVDGVLPIGNCNANYYRHYGVPAKMMFWCACPVDGHRLLSSVNDKQAARASIRKKWGIGSDDFVFASVGKYIARKRHSDVIEAFLRLPQSARNRSWVMLIGEGPLRSELAEGASRTDGRAILTGFVKQTEMPAYLASCDAVVVASDSDPHPLAVTEALFFGRAIIGSDAIGCIGPDDTLREGENGVIYRCGDIDQLSGAMLELLTNSELCERFGNRSREIAEGQDVREAAGKFTDAFRRVMGTQRSGVVERMARWIPALPGRSQ